MKLSIIVPVYNVEEYIIECIDSVLSQTYKDWELILVNDGSTDNSGKICDEYALKDNRINVIHKENEGLSSARNAGIDVAKGEYITFIDSDDVLLNDDIYYKIIKIFNEDNSIDVVQYDVIHKWKSSEEHKREYPFKTYCNKQDILEGYLTENIHVSCCDKVFKTEIFKNIRFPLGQISEDIAIIPNIVEHTNKLQVSEIGYYGYRYRDGSITIGSYDIKKIKSAYISCYKYLSYCYSYKSLRPLVLKKYVSLAWNYISKVRQSNNINVTNIYNEDIFIHTSIRELFNSMPKDIPLSLKLKTFVICVLGVRATMSFQKIFTHNR
ncbi:MAG: glycosyltransferase family 2 protein [Bacteroidales bacterium]|nr:glycosyltransferase family 2 protein [Bacteroidales bacterium]